MLFTDLAQALADVPPDRLAGVIMITDGEVHDVPASAAALGFDAPVHALLTGKPGEFDRRLAGAERATLRHRRQRAEHRGQGHRQHGCRAPAARSS